MFLEALCKVHPDIPIYSRQFVNKSLVSAQPTEYCWDNVCDRGKVAGCSVTILMCQIIGLSGRNAKIKFRKLKRVLPLNKLCKN